MKRVVRELQEVSQLVEHLFRHEAGKMVATLTRVFGIEHLSLAEDVIQEALARALQFGIVFWQEIRVIRAIRDYKSRS